MWPQRAGKYDKIIIAFSLIASGNKAYAKFDVYPPFQFVINTIYTSFFVANIPLTCKKFTFIVAKQ